MLIVRNALLLMTFSRPSVTQSQDTLAESCLLLTVEPIVTVETNHIGASQFSSRNISENSSATL